MSSFRQIQVKLWQTLGVRHVLHVACGKKKKKTGSLVMSFDKSSGGTARLALCRGAQSDLPANTKRRRERNACDHIYAGPVAGLVMCQLPVPRYTAVLGGLHTVLVELAAQHTVPESVSSCAVK